MPRATRTDGKGNPSAPNSSKIGAGLIPNQAKIFRELKDKGVIPPGRPLDERTRRFRDNGRFCEYHQDVGHNTDECRSLAREMEKYRSQEKLSGPPRNQQNYKGTAFMILGGDENAKAINSIQGKRPRREIISFSEEDSLEIRFLHQDPLVFSPVINEFLVQRVLVDTGASVDIIY